MIRTYYRQPYYRQPYPNTRYQQADIVVPVAPPGVDQWVHERQTANSDTQPASSDAAPEEVPSRGWQPAIAVSETPTQFTLQIELPGVPAADINLEATQQTLRIYGERHRPATTGHSRSEFRYGPFARTLQFGVAIDPHGITSDRQAGIVTLTIPKLAAQQPKTVKVTVATPTPAPAIAPVESTPAATTPIVAATTQGNVAPERAEPSNPAAAPIAATETSPTVIHLPGPQNPDLEEDPWLASA